MDQKEYAVKKLEKMGGRKFGTNLERLYLVMISFCRNPKFPEPRHPKLVLRINTLHGILSKAH